MDMLIGWYLMHVKNNAIYNFKKWCILILFILGLWGLLYILVNSIYKNVSQSEPLGYYLAYPSYHYSVNDLVLICIDDTRYLKVLRKLNLPDVSGSCSNGSPYLLKRIVAMANDEVRVTQNGVEINHKLYRNSKVRLKHNNIDLLAQPLGYIHLKMNEFFVLGETPTSYDSRYFGVIKQSQIYKKVLFLEGAHL